MPNRKKPRAASEPASTGGSRGTIQSVDRAARILRALASGPRRLGVSELADRLQITRPTVHGLLQTLQMHGFVEQDRESEKYQFGPGPAASRQLLPRSERAPRPLDHQRGAACGADLGLRPRRRHAWAERGRGPSRLPSGCNLSSPRGRRRAPGSRERARQGNPRLRATRTGQRPGRRRPAEADGPHACRKGAAHPAQGGSGIGDRPRARRGCSRRIESRRNDLRSVGGCRRRRSAWSARPTRSCREAPHGVFARPSSTPLVESHGSWAPRRWPAVAGE